MRRPASTGWPGRSVHSGPATAIGNGCSPSFARRSVFSLKFRVLVATRLEAKSSGARRAGIEAIERRIDTQFPLAKTKKAPAKAGANAEKSSIEAPAKHACHPLVPRRGSGAGASLGSSNGGARSALSAGRQAVCRKSPTRALAAGPTWFIGVPCFSPRSSVRTMASLRSTHETNAGINRQELQEDSKMSTIAASNEQLLEEMREVNLAYLVLAQHMIRADTRAGAVPPGRRRRKPPTMIDQLTPAQMMKIAGANHAAVPLPHGRRHGLEPADQPRQGQGRANDARGRPARHHPDGRPPSRSRLSARAPRPRPERARARRTGRRPPWPQQEHPHREPGRSSARSR
ncbi:MAG: flagellar transcriptional regulator FlhD [Ignavibacteriales bacterium]|nr:flagellar transcriptional regulator FlhD [Ignavibacteriales bacterium]